MDLNYFELFVDLRDWLVDKNPTLTSDITSSVKSYFSDKYQNHTVLPNDNSSEYLLDVMGFLRDSYGYPLHPGSQSWHNPSIR